MFVIGSLCHVADRCANLNLLESRCFEINIQA